MKSKASAPSPRAISQINPIVTAATINARMTRVTCRFIAPHLRHCRTCSCGLASSPLRNAQRYNLHPRRSDRQPPRRRRRVPRWTRLPPYRHDVLIARLGRDWHYVGRRWPVCCVRQSPTSYHPWRSTRAGRTGGEQIEAPPGAKREPEGALMLASRASSYREASIRRRAARPHKRTIANLVPTSAKKKPLPA